MNFTYELDLYSLEIYRMCKYELPASRLSKASLSSDSHDRDSSSEHLTRRLVKTMKVDKRAGNWRQVDYHGWSSSEQLPLHVCQWTALSARSAAIRSIDFISAASCIAQANERRRPTMQNDVTNPPRFVPNYTLCLKKRPRHF